MLSSSNLVSGPTAKVVNFLAHLLSRYQSHLLSAFNSALISVHDRIDNVEVGKHNGN